MMKNATVKAAAVQAAPVYLDLSATIEKTVSLIKAAAEKGCNLIVFPETWLPGYPWFIWINHTAHNMKYFGAYHQNSLVFDSDEFNAIGRAAKENNIFVSLGASERDHGSLYIAQFLFGSDGSTLAKRRKLKPTHQERSLFGEGSGSDIQVCDTDIGRVGQLSCWENMQPLVKQAMYSFHEQIHCAAWPSFSVMTEQSYALGPDFNLAVSQMYAAEGQCFVVAACNLVSDEMMDMLVEADHHNELMKAGGGHSAIFGPDGRPIGNRLKENEEGLVIAELNMEDITYSKLFLDPVGHYSRPDIVRLLLNTESQSVTQNLVEAEEETAEEDDSLDQTGL